MSLVKHAQDELKKIDWVDDKEIYHGMLSKSVMEIVEVFSQQQHSGHSASIVRRVLMRLLNFEPLSALTGQDEEWELVDEKNEIYQNKRYSIVFKKGKNGQAHINQAGENIKIDFPYDLK